MKTLISYVTLIAFVVTTTFYPLVSYADEPDPPVPNGQVATLKKGDAAPFDGTLFSVPATARLLTDLKFTQEQCQIQTARELGLLRADMQLKIDTTQAALDSCLFKHTELLAIKDSQILFLQEQLEPPKWYEHPVFWFAVGFVIAAGTTVGITHAVNSPSQ